MPTPSPLILFVLSVCAVLFACYWLAIRLACKLCVLFVCLIALISSKLDGRVSAGEGSDSGKVARKFASKFCSPPPTVMQLAPNSDAAVKL